MAQDFLLESYDQPYPRRCLFSVWGADRLQQFNMAAITTLFVHGVWFASLLPSRRLTWLPVGRWVSASPCHHLRPWPVRLLLLLRLLLPCLLQQIR